MSGMKIIRRDNSEHKGCGCYVGGYFTVEAAFVFPIMIMVIVAVLRLGMEVHDDMVDTALAQYLFIKSRSIEQSSYSPIEHGIDLREVVNAGIIDFSGVKKEVDKLYAEMLVKEYRDKIILYSDEAELPTVGVSRGLKNSTIVRTIHVMKSRAERMIGND